MQYLLFTMSLSHTVWPLLVSINLLLHWWRRWMRKGEEQNEATGFGSRVESNILLSVAVFGDRRKSTHAVLWSRLDSSQKQIRTHAHTLLFGRLANDSHKLNGLSSVVFNTIGTRVRENVPNDTLCTII